MISIITVKEITFWNGNLIYAIRNGSDLWQILEYFAMLSRSHSRGPTYDFGSVTRIAFKSKSVQKSNIERQSLKIQIRSSFAWW